MTLFYNLDCELYVYLNHLADIVFNCFCLHMVPLRYNGNLYCDLANKLSVVARNLDSLVEENKLYRVEYQTTTDIPSDLDVLVKGQVMPKL